MKKIRKTAALILSAAVAFSSFGFVSYAEDDTALCCESIVARADASSYKMKVGETKTFSAKLSFSKISDIKIACSGKDVDIIKISNIRSGKNKVTFKVKALDEGKIKLRVYNKKTKKSVSFTLNIKGSVSEDDDKPDVSVSVNGGRDNNTGNDNNNTDKDKKDRDSSENESNEAKEVLDLVNKERKANGLEPLKLDENLCAAAQKRAKELSSKFSHTRPDGTQCFTVLDEFDISSYNTAGENIAYGYVSPEDVMDGWMNSPGHRANILNSDFTTLGVGYDPETNGWVQLFTG